MRADSTNSYATACPRVRRDALVWIDGHQGTGRPIEERRG